MPIYSYKCKNKKCKKDFDVFYGSHESVKEEEPLEKCKHCGSIDKIRNVSGGTSFSLKGGGWYKPGGPKK